MQECFKCKIKKDLGEFYKHPQMPSGRVNKCKECNKKDVRLNYKRKKSYYNRYDRDRIRNNFNYMFLHRHSTMLHRVNGRTKQKYSVTGKDVCTKEEFLKWCYSERQIKIFTKIHSKWKSKGYPRKLCPSIDRVDNSKGYIISNLQWLTQQQNSSKHNK